MDFGSDSHFTNHWPSVRMEPASLLDRVENSNGNFANFTSRNDQGPLLDKSNRNLDNNRKLLENIVDLKKENAELCGNILGLSDEKEELFKERKSVMIAFESLRREHLEERRKLTEMKIKFEQQISQQSKKISELEISNQAKDIEIKRLHKVEHNYTDLRRKHALITEGEKMEDAQQGPQVTSQTKESNSPAILDFDPKTTKVLRMKLNPLTDGKYIDSVVIGEVRQQKQRFKKRDREFRRLIKDLFGFIIENPVDNEAEKYRLQSIYSDSIENSLIFKSSNKNGTISLLDAPMSDSIRPEDIQHLQEYNSYPLFLNRIYKRSLEIHKGCHIP